MNLILKSLLFPLLLLLTALPVQAEEGKWIDGIRFRFVSNSPDDCPEPTHVSCTRNMTGIYMPWKIEDRISPYFAPAPENESAIVVDNRWQPLFLFALELPETLMSSWSFRGGLLEFEFPAELKDLEPMPEDRSARKRGALNYSKMNTTTKTSLYNDFFNASDKSFADANSNWAMSADVTSSRIFLGYTWGFFIPIGENHRFFKVGAGLGIYYIDLSLKLNLCSYYNFSPINADPECVGKTEIDSYSGKKLGIASASHLTLLERRTKNSIWRFMQLSSSAAIGSNDKGYIRVKLKNHRSLALFIGSQTSEIITYTYRF